MNNNTQRPSLDQYYLAMADVIATRGTCARRRVGCVLVDPRGIVLATGYNGRPRGWPHCLETPCFAAASASGVDLDGCEAIHAEQNALLRCANVDAIHACYVSVAPCVTCVKLLLNTGCRRIVFGALYPHEEVAGSLAARAEVEWRLIVRP